MLDQGGVVGGKLAALEGAHEDDAAARAVGFVASGKVGGAGGEAEAAVDAGVEGGIVGLRPLRFAQGDSARHAHARRPLRVTPPGAFILYAR